MREAFERRGQTGDSWFDPGHQFLVQTRERDVLKLLARRGYRDLSSAAILEVGCGTGRWLRDLIKWGACPDRLVGVDLLEGRLSEARRTCPDRVRLIAADARRLPLPTASFDLVVQATLFTSVPGEDKRAAMAGEMLRVVKPGGMLLWYDYHVDNRRNADTRAVTKQEIRRLFPGCRLELRRVTLAPPIVRLLASRAWLPLEVLSKVPLLRTHYLGVIQPS